MVCRCVVRGSVGAGMGIRRGLGVGTRFGLGSEIAIRRQLRFVLGLLIAAARPNRNPVAPIKNQSFQ